MSSTSQIDKYDLIQYIGNNMKRNKYRAWHRELKVMFSAEEMAQDQLCLLTTGYFINVHSIPRLSKIDYQHKMIPLQYIGIDDKVGKEIYEDDIVDYKGNFYQVAYEPEYGCYGLVKNGKSGKRSLVGHGGSSTRYSPYLWNWLAKKVTVAGNIYQNPELLEKE